MVLGDPNYTYNLTFNRAIIECCKEDNVLGVKIDDKLTFTPHLRGIIKKATQKLYALSQVKYYMGFE